jgi:hypothetical protein
MVNGGASSLLIRYFTTGSIVLGSGIFKIVLINHWKKKWFFSYLVDKRKFSKFVPSDFILQATTFGFLSKT